MQSIFQRKHLKHITMEYQGSLDVFFLGQSGAAGWENRTVEGFHAQAKVILKIKNCSTSPGTHLMK